LRVKQITLIHEKIHLSYPDYEIEVSKI